ncbi:MAG: phenylalanine--tRNA ligase subunit alpha [Candidatus Magasanikbacteria bacterium]
MDIEPKDLEKIKEKSFREVKNASSKEELEEIRINYLGRDGELNNILRSLSEVPIEKRREIGPVANNLRDKLEELIAERQRYFEENEGSEVDLTKPGEGVREGHLHPLTHVQREARDIFQSLNFSIVDGPELESEYYNFTALNIPPDHPARDMWDTFWVEREDEPEKEEVKEVLRTHTSPVQVRYMESHNSPIQMVVPGRTFRYEATDSSHEINFYQLEGLMVGEDVTLANFKYIIEEFLENFFGFGVEFRFRPSYFPFTEPSLEVDIKLPESDEWLEVLGAGMVHRNVFDAVHFNPNEVQGFAFGVGLDRLAMIKYDIEDVRLFYSGDLRFIKQF